jgi:hypothetical protein
VGPTGPAAVWVTRPASTFIPGGAPGPFVKIATLSLPAGNYLVVVAGMIFDWTGNHSHAVNCDLYKNTNAGTLLANSWADDEDSVAGAIFAKDVVSSNAAFTVDLYCRNDEAEVDQIQSLHMTATRVTGVTTQ